MTVERSLPPWLSAPFARFARALAAGRLGHAVLIDSPPGWGAAALGRAIALQVLDRAETADDVDIAQIAHPDLRWIVPSGKGEQISIDTVRDLGEYVASTTQVALHKAVVLNPADALNVQAANALLKALEEPPSASVIVLVTESAHELLPTLRSRTWRLRIQPAPRATVLEWLAAETRSPGAATLAALAFEYGYAPYSVRAAAAREEAPIGPLIVAVAEGRLSPVAAAQQLAKLPLDDVVARSMRYVVAAARAGRRDTPGFPATLACMPHDALWSLWLAHLDARRASSGTTNPNAQLLLEGLLFGWRRAAARHAA